MRLLQVIWPNKGGTCWDRIEEHTSESQTSHLGYGFWVSYLQGRLISLLSSRYSWTQLEQGSEIPLQPVEWRDLTQRAEKEQRNKLIYSQGICVHRPVIILTKQKLGKERTCNHCVFNCSLPVFYLFPKHTRNNTKTSIHYFFRHIHCPRQTHTLTNHCFLPRPENIFATSLSWKNKINLYREDTF